MERKEIETKAEDLVSRFEKGETDGLERELNAMSASDRLQVARAMDRINDEHRQANSSLPDLVLDVQTDKHGKEYLSDMQSSEERAWYNPLKYVDGERSSSDVYDQPLHERLARKLQEKAPVIKEITDVSQGLDKK